MNKIKRRFLDVFARYFILILVAMPNLYLFYLMFTPLTFYPVYFLLNLFFGASLIGGVILSGQIPIELINACIAGSAYYLLLILNLSIPNIKIRKRIKMVLFAFAFLLVINILRIFLLSTLLINGSVFFDLTHKIFWYLFSMLFVVGIWLFEIKIFKIKEIPVYSDLKFLWKNSLLKDFKKSKRAEKD